MTLYSACLFVLILPATAQTPALSTPNQNGEQAVNTARMQMQLGDATDQRNDWERDEKIEIILAVTVGLVGLVIGGLQGISRDWVKPTAAGLGLIVSGITLITGVKFPSDYKSLRHAVSQSKPLIATLKESFTIYQIPGQTDKAKSEIWDRFKEADSKFVNLALTVGDGEPETSKNSSANGTPGTILSLRSVYAQSTATPPDWTRTDGAADGSGRYFVGYVSNTDLSKAKKTSYDNAIFNAAQYLTPDHKFDQAHRAQFEKYAALAKELSVVTDTSITYEKFDGQGNRLYEYYTRVKLPNDASSIKLQVRHDIDVEVRSDSSVVVPNAGITLVLKHMVHGMPFAHLYIIRGTNATVPFTSNKQMADAATSNFIDTRCGGLPQEAELTGSSHDPICLKLSRYSVRSASGRVNNFGIILTDAGKFNLLLTDFGNLQVGITFSPVD